MTKALKVFAIAAALVIGVVGFSSLIQVAEAGKNLN
jgi:hypothetical protein